MNKSFAEYMILSWTKAYPIPDSVSDSTAVAVMIQGLTALTFMTEAYNVQKDDWILIHTVAGGLGLMLSQVAQSRGAHVIGTTSSKEKAELAKQYGAEHVIIYTQEDTLKRVLEITNGKGAVAIFDGVGKDT
jgi:NADPH:quinone reductase